MRNFEDVEQRWTQLFNTSIGVDLRQAIRDDSGFDPCEEGLRSVCWRAFLLYGPLSQGSWTKKVSESRNAYTSLREHFLKFIDNPNDLHSSADPLADDESSPWSTLRQDEISREEIFQDVTRCMQDNFFFREPTTQRRLLDILFIYSKLNPDTGYRQGMHELLAPILWAIDQDAVNLATVTDKVKANEGADFMLTVLDRKFAEHDAFSLFCAVMQTAKSFYEMGEGRDSSAIVAQSNRIHDELLAAVDPDLAHHLQVIGVLPQIYSIRWIRLLFGREFDFKDVLKMWDMLFAENITMEVVDMTCVAILLRVRWQLIDADYTTAITLLTRFKLPPSKESPRSLVKDAAFLTRNKTAEGGASVIQYYSGQRPKVYGPDEERPYSPAPSQQTQNARRWNHTRSSPSVSPARFTAVPQKQLENLFSEVSGTLQRRTEGWNVSKAVRGAVSEVRRNVNNFQAGHSRESSVDVSSRSLDDERQALKKRIEENEKRNKTLAKMLDAALTSLRACTPNNGDSKSSTDDVFNVALARIQFVTVYLADSDVPIPEDSPTTKDIHEAREVKPELHDEVKTETRTDAKQAVEKLDESPEPRVPSPQLVIKRGAPRIIAPAEPQLEHQNEDQPAETSRKHQTRPSLADSSFSFMLGENRHRSSFVSSVADLPEQRRGSDANKDRPKHLWEEEKKDRKERKQDRRGSKHENKHDDSDDGFTMNPLKQPKTEPK